MSEENDWFEEEDEEFDELLDENDWDAFWEDIDKLKKDLKDKTSIEGKCDEEIN